jgi:hypothetical protein
VNTVSPDEANNFNPDQGRCCTEDGFRVYLEGTDAHKWNVSAAQVFAASFMKDPSRQALDPDVIGRKFRIYVRTLIRLYKSQQRTEQSLSLKKRENRRRSRKHNVSLPNIETESSTDKGYSVVLDTPCGCREIYRAPATSGDVGATWSGRDVK